MCCALCYLLLCEEGGLSCAALISYCCLIHRVPLLDRSGFVGTEVVKQLLEKGYTVRATVRSTSNKQKVAHLLALGEALPGVAAACPCIGVSTVQLAGLTKLPVSAETTVGAVGALLSFTDKPEALLMGP